MSALTKSHKTPATPRHPAASVGLGAIYSIIATIVLLAASAALTHFGILPEKLMPHATVASSFVGTLFGSRLVAKRAPERKMIIALGSAALLFVFVFATGRAISGEAGGAGVTLASLPAIISGGGISGFVQNRQKRPKR